MTSKQMIAVDGNEACASVAHRSNEVAVIYPITPSSTMGELADQWSSDGQKNIWGQVPEVTEMQSEAGAAGAVHGALQAGALATTFTASQGLLLMIPNMYKIAGELTSFCMHVSARTIAVQALSIFGDHSDVMACRQTGFALLSSGSVQEAQDFAAIGQAATLASRIPVLHFFDGFRTSHEVAKFEYLDDDQLRQMIDEEQVAAHRRRALTPDAPVLRGSAQNPDTFFQALEARNPFYNAAPAHFQQAMDHFASITGRAYHLFDYHGHPEADRVIIIMGSGAETVHETIDYLNAKGAKLGVLKVRLFRPFALDAFVAALPISVRSIAVLDRCKESGALGEPLYMDVITGLMQAKAQGLRPAAADPVVIGGRYGLSSKEFTPAMVKAVFDELAREKPKAHFTVGIEDDVTHLSLPYDHAFSVEPANVTRAVFFGLGADGTVGANKNSIKIIAENTPNYAQGYFVYDSKKSGAVTISHLRFAPNHIRSAYLIDQANFVACHQFRFVDRYDMLSYAAQGATFLLNSPYRPDEVWNHLPREVQEQIISKKLRFFVIDAVHVAQETGMGRRINTAMQAAFFAISGALPRDEAIGLIKKSIEDTYGHKSAGIVEKNFAAVDYALSQLHEVKVPGSVTSNRVRPPVVPDDAPDFVKTVTAAMLASRGDTLPVSAFPPDGTWPMGTARFEKRNLALDIPIWEPSLCIQCNKCVLVCPHAAIRAKAVESDKLKNAPATFKSMPYKGAEYKNHQYVLQVAPEDCTGCTLCVKVCPGKDKTNPERLSLAMAPQPPLLEAEKANFDFFLELPSPDRKALTMNAKNSQMLEPLFEFSGACLGCGETPYIKLITQVWGDRAMIANATGCSSIFGGNLPTTPYTTDKNGRGPAWANSLFEDNAEFGLGFRLALDRHREQAKDLVRGLSSVLGDTLTGEILNAKQGDETGIEAQRARVTLLREKISKINTPEARRLNRLADYLVEKVVWIVGGDGWAYDIGYGGLDHVLASGRNINILVMDTEVYSNTGGQQSKATPTCASAKFAVSGKASPKKDLGLMAMSYGNIYVGAVALGAKDQQAVKTMLDAVSFDGPSLVIGYSHCIAHGYEMADALDQQRLAVAAGYWPLYRYDPRRLDKGEIPLVLDSTEPKAGGLEEFMHRESRFQMVARQDPARFKTLIEHSEATIRRRFDTLKRLAGTYVTADKAN